MGLWNPTGILVVGFVVRLAIPSVRRGREKPTGFVHDAQMQSLKQEALLTLLRT